MVSKPFVCENNEAARGIKVEELPGNFGHPWATQNGVSLCLYGTPPTLQGCNFYYFPACFKQYLLIDGVDYDKCKSTATTKLCT